MGMMLKCRDVGVDCDFEAHGKNEGNSFRRRRSMPRAAIRECR